MKLKHIVTFVFFFVLAAAFVCGWQLGGTWQKGLAGTGMGFMAMIVGIVIGQMHFIEKLKQAKRMEARLKARDKEFEKIVLDTVKRERLQSRMLVMEIVEAVAKGVAMRVRQAGKGANVQEIVESELCLFRETVQEATGA